ncbi:sensor histidine kinase [Amycolatopsis sp. NPDC057786]|uniref:sensor histidine kinase n=1 Tax=Amycolatopsis sp. NPDC057786 TaxID=3346250 RepID=UPI00366C001B
MSLRRPMTAEIAAGIGVAVLVAVSAVTRIGPSGPEGTLGPSGAALLVLLAALLTARRIFPFGVLVGVNAVVAAWFVLDCPGRLITVAALIACYTVAAERGWRLGAAAWAVTAAVSTVVVHGTLGVTWFDDRAVNALSLELAAVALGSAVHYHRAYAAGARERALRLAEQARLRETEQRLEIARELHDVVGHTLVAISVQAGVATHVLARNPEQGAAALRTIKTISDEGLAEVQALLGLLRVDGTTADRSGLARLDTLLDLTRATGVPVELVVGGERRSLPPRVDLAAFRTVQEALTNARKHARPTSIRVCLLYGDDVLEIGVRNDGAGESSPSPTGGNGITGLRSRATALGGTLRATRSGEIFEVTATLPTRAENL